MSSKQISLAIILSGLAVSGFIFFSDIGISKKNEETPSFGNVFVQGERQTIEITAKGGFEPKISIAQAGIPTTLKIHTQGTFDCSSTISIPDLGIRQNLPNSGITEIDLGVNEVGILNGSCGMGMYPFEIDFR